MVDYHFTKHAYERCEEMGISTKVAKHILHDFARTDRPARDGRIVTSAKHPEYAVVYKTKPNGLKLITSVVFRTYVDYDRDGAAFVPKEGT